MLHGMTTVTVRVTPRSTRTEVARGSQGEIVVRVRAAPEGGKATAQAAAALAALLGVPARAVTLRVGARSRNKVFAIEGVSDDDLRRALNAL
jgi:uncharacterized protein YggU (UPF0235/DUF167 family)